MGFAIPINTISRVVPQLVQNGRVRRPDSGIARVFQTDRGLLIATLVPGGPAERAGLQGPRIEREQRRQGPFVYEYQTVDRAAADMIVAVDGRPIKTADDFLDAIEAKQPGDAGRDHGDPRRPAEAGPLAAGSHGVTAHSRGGGQDAVGQNVQQPPPAA